MTTASSITSDLSTRIVALEEQIAALKQAVSSEAVKSARDANGNDDWRELSAAEFASYRAIPASAAQNGERPQATAYAATELDDRLARMEKRIERVNDRLDQLETSLAIARGLEDVAQGRVRPAREVLEELRIKHNIPVR
jgi:uncharacterized protein YceH (UPF0502 family)